jgi:FkbM family methyltransferase
MAWSRRASPCVDHDAFVIVFEKLDAMRRLPSRVLLGARRAFYNLGGPWHRCRLFETFGSERYSQPAMFGMDRRLAELMPWHDGVFVEAGAHDGYTQSNTYYLERHRGWTGLLIEPIPELRAHCVRRRPRSCVMGVALVNPTAAAGTVTMRFGDLMSTMDDGRHAGRGLEVTGRHAYSVDVPARTLSESFAAAGLTKVDLLVLDVEGHEHDVLAGLDLEGLAPRYILVEMLDRAVQQLEIDELLERRYEPLEALSDYDVLYERRKSLDAPA